jgi:hypothetical protein
MDLSENPEGFGSLRETLSLFQFVRVRAYEAGLTLNGGDDVRKD